MLVLNNGNPSKIQIVYKSRVSDQPYICNGCAIFEPAGRCLILGFGFHHYDKTFPKKFIESAIEKDLGIIYLCDELPRDYIIDEHIVYVVTKFEWFTHLLFKDLSMFKGVFHNGNNDSQRYADILATRGGIHIPLLGDGSNLHQLNAINKQIKNIEQSILVETFDGLGDVLLSLPAAKTMHDKGYTVSYYTRPGFEPIFDNLDFIKKVYTNHELIPTTSFGNYISLSHKLSDYQREYNQQDRIYSSAYFFNLAPNDLTTKIPIIKLSEDEISFAKALLSSYNNTVGVAWEACGFSRSYPQDYTQSLCDSLKAKGFTPIILSANPIIFNNAVNLGGKLNLRQLFSTVSLLDYVITVDTGILHIAGAFDKYTIALFGPIPAKWRGTTYKHIYPIEPTRVPCYPCMDKQFVESAKMKCKFSEEYCLRTISPNKIIKTLTKIRKDI